MQIVTSSYPSYFLWSNTYCSNMAKIEVSTSPGFTLHSKEYQNTFSWEFQGEITNHGHDNIASQRI